MGTKNVAPVEVFSIKLLCDILEDPIAKWATRYELLVAREQSWSPLATGKGDRATVNFSPCKVVKVADFFQFEDWTKSQNWNANS